MLDNVTGFGGFGLSAVGVALSVWALIQAADAKAAVSKVLKRSSNQIDRDFTRKLLDQLSEARLAAIGRRPGASRLASAGRSPQGDVRALEVAQDALATGTVDSDATMTAAFRIAATELAQALKDINTPAARDGWSDALGVLQGMIPQVENLQRRLGVSALQ